MCISSCVCLCTCFCKHESNRAHVFMCTRGQTIGQPRVPFLRSVKHCCFYSLRPYLTHSELSHSARLTVQGTPEIQLSLPPLSGPCTGTMSVCHCAWGNSESQLRSSCLSGKPLLTELPILFPTHSVPFNKNTEKAQQWSCGVYIGAGRKTSDKAGRKDLCFKLTKP